VGRWIRSLRDSGQAPTLVILEVVESDWQAAERRWIAYYRDLGADLTNHTDGGEGLINPTSDTRAKLRDYRLQDWADPERREVLLAILRSPERRTRISTALRGKRKSAQHVANLPQNRKGRQLSPEHAARLRDVLREFGYRHPKGVPMSSETRASISAALKGNQHTLGRRLSAEERERRSRSQKGRPKSPEHREKIRIAALRRWARARGELEASDERISHVQDQANFSGKSDSWHEHGSQ
jgi:hypothetical protein